MKKFIIPTSQEVTDYAKSIDYNIDPERFIDYYEMIGWRVNKQPMKCWQAAVRTWKRNDKSYQKPTKLPYNVFDPNWKNPQPMTESDYNTALERQKEAIDAERERRFQEGARN